MDEDAQKFLANLFKQDQALPISPDMESWHQIGTMLWHFYLGVKEAGGIDPQAIMLAAATMAEIMTKKIKEQADDVA